MSLPHFGQIKVCVVAFMGGIIAREDEKLLRDVWPGEAGRKGDVGTPLREFSRAPSGTAPDDAARLWRAGIRLHIAASRHSRRGVPTSPPPGTCQTPPLEARRRIERIEHLYPVPGKQKDAQFALTEPRAHALGPKGSFQRASRDEALGQTSFGAAAKDGCL